MSLDLKHLKNNNNINSSNKKKLNPIIENLLKDPITFKIAKNPDKVTIKPSSYKVFKSKKFDSKRNNLSGDLDPKQSSHSSPSSNNKKMARPKSLAEAVANYSGKKYSRANNELSPIPIKSKKSKQDQKERLKELLLKQSNSQSNTTLQSSPESDASNDPVGDKRVEFSNDKNNDNCNGNDEADGNNNNIDTNDDDDNNADEDDDDFHTAESNDDQSDDDQSDDEFDVYDDEIGEKDNNSDDDGINGSPSGDEEEVENTDEQEEVENNDETDTLKKDLKEDELSKEVIAETPPTSNDDENLKLLNNNNQLIDNNYSIDQFYDLNELANNHGSNGSKRIIKSWDDYIENHVPLGLLNHGVTCYMNAAVQSMCHIPSLTKYLIDVQNGKYDEEIKPDSVTKVLASTVTKMFRLGHNKKIVYINPKKLCKQLDNINCMMSEWQQEDSHEYFMSLMSRLQEDSTPPGVKLNKSIIYDIFGGLLDQTVTCKNCGHISTTEQEFYDLSLGLDNRKKRSSLMVDARQLDQLRDQIEKCKSSTENDKIQLSKILQQRILLANNEESLTDNVSDLENPKPPSSNNESINSSTAANTNNQIQSTPESQVTKTYSLENSIKDFFTPEIIKTDKRDQSGYVCEKCKIKTNAIKISTIQRSPETLSIHLKRFRFNGQQSQKVKANVSYPEVLDLTSFTTNMSTPTRYKLISVIIHQGRSVSSGHYIAHCRQPDNSWATYDDEYVNKIPKASALSDPGAYVLFYERLTYKDIKCGTDENADKQETELKKEDETPHKLNTLKRKSSPSNNKSNTSNKSRELSKRRK